jgi:hypothetical protein
MKRALVFLMLAAAVTVTAFAQEAGSEEKQTSQELSALADNTNDQGGIGMGKLMETQRKIEKGVVSGYKAIENGVVSGYKAVEDGVVSGYKKMEKKLGDPLVAFFSGKDETSQTEK